MVFTALVLLTLLATAVAAPTNETDACGQAFTRNAEPGQGKVIVGPDSHLGDWPWLAYVVACEESCWSCSASLVSAKYIITAAHCFGDCYPDCGGAFEISVRVGTVDGKEGGQVFAVESHHFFNNNTSIDELALGGHDIVLVKLNASVTFSDTVSPVCLSEAKPEDHTTYVVDVGFGTTCPDNGSCVYTGHSRESIIPLKPLDYW